jgi:hypothetical protein
MAEVAKTSWDMVLFGIPLIALLVFGFFRLDQVFTASKGKTTDKPDPQASHKRHERSMHSDPDGTPWDDN